MLRRREFIRSGLISAGALALGPGFWREALAQAPQAKPGRGPYGPLGRPDLNGISLPEGFSSRLIARGQAPVAGTAYVWHVFSDGQATYPTADGGWILVSNSESVPQTGAGASAIRFRPDGEIADAYRILGGTSLNCAGGKTPWGTWLSCEEFDGGRVWECDPTGAKPAVVHPAMGVFTHEAVAVDPDDQRVYLTEDEGDGGFYRFTPQTYPDLSRGLLELAVVRPGGTVEWRAVPDPSARTTPTRKQLPEMTRFRRGEGIWWDSGVAYVATTSDSRIHAYNTVTETIAVLYDGVASNGPLRQVDNVTVSASGDLFACEDSDDLDICVISPEREVAKFLQLSGPQHVESELAGAVFDPSGRRLYFASQRAQGGVGAIYEITGPFRQERPPQRFPPALRVLVPREISPRALERRGLPVEVRIDRAARLSLALRTPRLRRGRDGRLRRARQTLLGRMRRRISTRRRHRLRLRLSRAGRRRLRRGRDARLAIAVEAVDRFGNRRRVTDEVRLRRPRPQRRG